MAANSRPTQRAERSANIAHQRLFESYWSNRSQLGFLQSARNVRGVSNDAATTIWNLRRDHEYVVERLGEMAWGMGDKLEAIDRQV